MSSGHRDIDPVTRREAEVLGSTPRIVALTDDDVVQGARERTAQLREAVSGIPTSADDVTANEMLLSLMRHVDLYDCLAALSVQLIAAGALPARDRELAVLRVSWLCQAPYEFGEHVRLATSLVGVSGEEIGWVVQGSTADGWNTHDRALLRATEELHGGAMISDDTWVELARTYDDRQLIELPVLVGQATMVAYFQNACRFRLAPGNDGLRAR